MYNSWWLAPLVLVGCWHDVPDDASAEIEALRQELADVKAQCATQQWVQEQGYASTQWVEDQGYAGETDLSALQATVDEHESRLEAAEATVTEHSTTLAALDGRVTDAEATLVDHADRVTTLEAVTDELVDRVGVLEGAGYLTQEDVADYLTHNGYLTDAALDDYVQVATDDDALDATVATEAELREHLALLNHYRIPMDMHATITIAAPGFPMADELEIHHPDGSQVEIVGGGATPEETTLSFTGSAGITTAYAAALGRLDNLSLAGDGTPGVAGVHVGAAGYVAAGNLRIHGFYYGIWAAIGGCVWYPVGGTSDVEIDDCTIGVYALYDAFVGVPDLVVQDCDEYAVLADSQASVYAPDATLLSAGSRGAYAIANSTLAIDRAVIDQNSVGVDAWGNSYVSAQGASFTGTSAVARGFNSGGGSTIEARNSTVSGGLVGYVAEQGSVIDAGNDGGYTWTSLLEESLASVSGGSYGFFAGISGSSPGDGIRCTDNSTCDVRGATLNSNGLAGVHAVDSTLIADDLVSTGNALSGIECGWNATCYADTATLTGNLLHGFDLYAGSVGSVSGAELSGNADEVAYDVGDGVFSTTSGSYLVGWE